MPLGARNGSHASESGASALGKIILKDVVIVELRLT